MSMNNNRMEKEEKPQHLWPITKRIPANETKRISVGKKGGVREGKIAYYGNNTILYRHPGSSSGAIRRIQPNKQSYLKSNLMISNIVHTPDLHIDHAPSQNPLRKSSVAVREEKGDVITEYEMSSSDLIPPGFNDAPQADAALETLILDSYKRCTTMKKFHQKSTGELRALINKISINAHQVYRQEMEKRRKQQITIDDQVNHLLNMREELIEKTAEILAFEEDSSYLGRKRAIPDRQLLKELKVSTAANRLLKIQSTRKIMRERTKNLHDSSAPSETEEHETSNVTLSESVISTTSETNTCASSPNNSQHQLKLFISKHGFQKALERERRTAIREGFMLHWKVAKLRAPLQKSLHRHSNTKRSKNRDKLTLREKEGESLICNSEPYQQFYRLKSYVNAFSSISDSFRLLGK